MTFLLDDDVAYGWLRTAYGDDEAEAVAGLPVDVWRSLYAELFMFGPAFREVQAFFDATERYADPQGLQAALLVLWDLGSTRPSDEKMKAHSEAEATFKLWSVQDSEVVSEFQYLIHSLDIQAWRVSDSTSAQVNPWHLLLVALLLSAKHYPAVMGHYLTFAHEANPAFELLGLPALAGSFVGVR